MKRAALLSLTATLVLAGAAFADVVTGTVAGTSSNSIDLTVFDAQGKPYPNLLRLSADDRTRLEGVPSLALLKPNDAVRVDVTQQGDGAWHADSVSRTGVSSAPAAVNQQYGVETVPAAAPAPAPSNALMNALTSPTGQKVIRNSIQGAVVGGVASATSGGKAGKGALIGAGTGVAAGLLSDYFSRPASTAITPGSNRGASPVTPTTQNYGPERKVIRRYDADGRVISEEEVPA